mgnify:CR=1 FL=1
MPKLSLCVPVFNRFDLAMRCVAALQATVPAGLAEIIVGDDCSPDGNACEWFPQGIALTSFRNEHNLGYSGNCNEMAKRARGDFLVFINSDAMALPGWWEPMLRLFESTQVGVVGPKLIQPNGRIQSCGGLYDRNRGPYHRHLGCLRTWRHANVTERVSWITGAVMMTPRLFFLELGGFDGTAYPNGYFEDVDYCEKVKTRGLEVWYCHEAEFTHIVGQSTSSKVRNFQDQLRAHDSFMRNSFTFHKRWDKAIVPDVKGLYVNY